MINLRSPLNFLGYGQVGLGILKSLVLEHQQQVCYFPIGQIECDPKYHELIKESIANQEIFDCDAPNLTIWHQNLLETRIGRSTNAAISFFELDRLNDREIRNINNHDIFISASSWASNIVKNSCSCNVKVVPMGVDSSFFQPLAINIEKPYRFLNVGKIEIRKGHDILHELFNRAFTKEDDVELYISWDNPFLDENDKKRWIDLYKNTELGDKIHFIPRVQDLRREYISADCGIFPQRAEAICLPALEMMSCNKPIIITNYSGPTEFCNKDNSYLVNIEQLETAVDGKWFQGEGKWAQIGTNQEAQFIEYMRNCYKNRINTNPAGRLTAEKLDWKNVTKSILEVLNGNN